MAGFFTFGILIASLLFLVVHNLNPYAHSKFIDAQERIKKEYVTQIIKPDQFISYQNKYTFFFGDKGNNGELSEILIEEQITPDTTLTHIAKNGQVIANKDSNALLLRNGSTQSYNKVSGTFSLLQFDTLVFDLNQLRKDTISSESSLSSLNSTMLKKKISALESFDSRLGRAVSLYHDRNAKVLLAMLFPLLEILGNASKACEPVMRQFFVGRGEVSAGLELERKLYIVRRLATHRIRYSGTDEEALFRRNHQPTLMI